MYVKLCARSLHSIMGRHSISIDFANCLIFTATTGVLSRGAAHIHLLSFNCGDGFH